MKRNKMRSGFTMFELIFVIILFVLMFGGVGSLLLNAEPAEINGVSYDTYGIASEGDVRNEKIEYELNPWSIVASVLLFETVIVPIYQIGWNLYEPVGIADPNKVKGSL